MSNLYRTEQSNELREEYITDVALKAYEAIQENVDQNIASETTTYANVLAHMTAAFILSYCEKESEIDELFERHMCTIMARMAMINTHIKKFDINEK